MPVLELPETIAVTESEYAELCAQGERWEVWQGELIRMTPAAGGHGQTTISLSSRVTVFIEDNNLGVAFAAETGFRVLEEPLTIMAPDFAFIQRSRVPNPFVRVGFVPVVPDLVLEVRSTHDRPADVAQKVALWLEVGAQIVWELNPRRQILTVFAPNAAPRELGPNDTLDAPALLPGWNLTLNRILSD